MIRALIAPFGRSAEGVAAVWPRPRNRARGGAREPELFERRGEPYPAAVVLRDLTAVVGDADAAARIVARFAATRVVLLALASGLTPAQMAEERAIARSYLAELPPDAERRLLERAVALTSMRVGRVLARCLIAAGDCAAKRQHAAGAFWLHHIGYLLANGAGWDAEALRAARAIEQAAHAAGAPRSERLWRRRVLALQRNDG